VTYPLVRDFQLEIKEDGRAQTSSSVWGACVDLMKDFFWHEPRLAMLGQKIEALADSHPSKSGCLFQLSLFRVVRNQAERKQLPTYASRPSTRSSTVVGI